MFYEALQVVFSWRTTVSSMQCQASAYAFEMSHNEISHAWDNVQPIFNNLISLCWSVIHGDRMRERLKVREMVLILMLLF